MIKVAEYFLFYAIIFMHTSLKNLIKNTTANY